MDPEYLFPYIPQLFKSLIIHDTVHQQKAISSMHEGLSQRSISILSRSIQDLHLEGFAIYIYRGLVRFFNGGVIL